MWGEGLSLFLGEVFDMLSNETNFGLSDEHLDLSVLPNCHESQAKL